MNTSQFNSKPTDYFHRLLLNVSNMPRQGISPQTAKEGLSYKIPMYVEIDLTLQIPAHNFVAMRRKGCSREG